MKPNFTLHPTVKMLRILPSAELSRYAENQDPSFGGIVSSDY